MSAAIKENNMLKLNVIIASTRPGRVGPTIGQWFSDFAAQQGSFEVELVDLADVNLPLLDEPAHPMLQKYEHEHTKNWSASVQAADAFIFVTPEYNYSPPPSLINALDYLYKEWNYKPVGFVSYGGLSGGMRSVQITKHIVTTLKMMPMVEAVTIPFFSQFINDTGEFVTAELHEKAATDLLNELHRWAEALRPLRAV
jgi:NAD(P)H-dependent FMN reductase